MSKSRRGGTDGAHARAHGEPFVGEPGKREGSYNATRAERERKREGDASGSREEE